MAGTSETPEGSPASPDDINSRLAEIAAELASEARFKEPSAAERARARVTAVRPAARPARRGPLRRWHSRRARRKAEELRSPVRAAGAPAPAPVRRPSRLARRAARRQAVFDRGYADATMPSRLRSGTTIVILMVLLIGVSIGLRYAFRHHSPAAPGGKPRDTPTAMLSGTPTVSPSATSSAAAAFDPQQPFQGQPAALYLTGAKGIFAPPATRLGRFSAAQGQQLSSQAWASSFAPGTQLVGKVSALAGVLCSNDGYVHPAFAGLPGASAPPTETPIDPYDLTSPPLANPSCVPTTGT